MGIKQSLNEEVLQTFRSIKHGSPRYRRERHRVLIHIIDNLISLGEPPTCFQHFSTKHFQALVNYWQSKGNTPSTIRNKIGILKWFLNQKGICFEFPDAEQIESQFDHKRHEQVKPYLNIELLDQVAHPLTRTMLAFQFYFGLTRIESARINTKTAVRGSELYINRNLAHNNKERYIPIIMREQRQAIAERKNTLQNQETLTDLLPERMLMNLYSAEVYHCSINPKTDFRLYYAHNQLSRMARKNISRDQAYKVVMDELGFKDKHKFLQFAL